MEKPGVEPGTPILQGSTAARCLPRAWSWFRATLSASSARRFHQISLPGALVRMPVIETGPDEWRSPARPSSYTRMLWFSGKRTESNRLPEGTAFTARRRHQPVLTCTSRSFHLFGCRDRSRTDLEQLMRLPGSRTSLQNMRGFSSPSRTAGPSAVCRISIALHPNWRKREVLIPNGKAIHLASNERRTPVRLRFLKIWRKAERTMPIRARRVPVAFQAMPTPRSVSLPKKWRSGEVSIPARCRAANFQNPLPSRRRPLQIILGFPRRFELRAFRFGRGRSVPMS